MAWPPPAMPTTRTNTTVMTTTHPAEHNAVNLAINDLVARVNTITSRLQTGVSLGTTNSSGVGAFSFNTVFPSTPNVVANAQTTGTLTLVVVIQSANTGGFTARVSDHNGAAFVGQINLAWVAALAALA